MTKIKLFSIIAVIIMLVSLLGFLNNKKSKEPGKLDSFAQCISDSGAKFYGAYWCTHCQAQKEMFGSSVKLLPYIECSTLDGQNQLEICKDNKIEGYPTWEFKDLTRLSGEIPLETLGEKTGCVLPE